jgi:hypothetical protein
MTVECGLKPIHITVIPAHPGWTVVSLDDGDSLYRVPVIAWQVDVFERWEGGSTSAQVTAITTNGDVGDHSPYALQFGNGAFSTVFADYDDEAGVLSYFREEEEERKRLRRDGRK